MRNRAVALVGLRATSQNTFRVLAQNEDEVLVGSDDLHLDFRASVRCTADSVEVVTVVQVHNRLGWLYLVPVRLVHSLIVKRMLRQASRHLDRHDLDQARQERERLFERDWRLRR